ncbi:hypothetical protein SDC9_116514 [bioreactor metagenome]|uniref:Uncharacterized protein n=1 Tax=bioreactor metagenome TaxID=1076179 RepID=A0A645BWK1_9ZZZZ
MASADALLTAMAASLPMWLPEFARRSKKNADKITTGIEKYSGVTPSATATARAPKDTWLSPSPIMEYRFKTSDTPSSAAHRLTSTPAISARCIKGQENISTSSITAPPSGTGGPPATGDNPQPSRKTSSFFRCAAPSGRFPARSAGRGLP